MEKLFSRWQDWAGDSRQRILENQKEDGVFWSCSLVRLMGQVSADQEVPGVAAVCLEAQATAIVCPAVGSGNSGCLAPQADLIHFITSSIISHFMGSFWIPLTMK